MRILQVINVRWYNATAWYALYLARLLTDAGHQVKVVALADTDTWRMAVRLGLSVEAIPLNSNHPLTLARAGFQAANLIRKFRPEVVNCHRGEAFFLWAALKKFGGYQLVRTRGDQRPPRSDLLNRHLHNRVADGVIVTNRAMAEYFRARMRTPANRLWLIHGGVDPGRYAFDPAGRARVRAEFGFADTDQVIGLVGRFDEVKGQRELIAAVAKLRHDLDFRDARLFLIGFPTATSQKQVEGWIAEAGIGEITRISGRREDVAACLSAVDVGALCSLGSEAIARAAFELMANGRPLVSTRVGVMPDLVGENALVPPGDVPALTLKLAGALRHESLRRDLVEAQRLVMSQHTAEAFLRRTLSVYQGLLD
jgi:glycosyltransferase involved in cell wall biosynthesis